LDHVLVGGWRGEESALQGRAEVHIHNRALSSASYLRLPPPFRRRTSPNRPCRNIKTHLGDSVARLLPKEFQRVLGARREPLVRGAMTTSALPFPGAGTSSGRRTIGIPALRSNKRGSSDGQHEPLGRCRFAPALVTNALYRGRKRRTMYQKVSQIGKFRLGAKRSTK